MLNKQDVDQKREKVAVWKDKLDEAGVVEVCTAAQWKLRRHIQMRAQLSKMWPIRHHGDVTIWPDGIESLLIDNLGR